MNIECQEILITLTNPRWKAQMYLDLIKAQAESQHRITLHNQAVATLDALVQEAHAEGRTDLETFYRSCLEKLRTGYDL